MRAFDKAVRRKPLAFAADAVGLWELNVGGGGTRLTWRALSACAQGASGATEGSEQCRILAIGDGEACGAGNGQGGKA